MSSSPAARKLQTGPQVIKSESAPRQKDNSQEKFEQLVQEVRLLEAYYQEVTTRQQALSSGIIEARAALDALEALSKQEKSELLIPIGGGALIPANVATLEKLVVSVGAGIAVEKDVASAKTFLTTRMQESERALTTLEEQRKEIGARLEAQRVALQRMAQ